MTNSKIKAASIAVDTIDFIEYKIHKITKDEQQKNELIDLVVELVKDHYKTKLF